MIRTLERSSMIDPLLTELSEISAKSQIVSGALKGLLGTAQPAANGRMLFEPDGLPGISVLISPRAVRAVGGV